MVIGNGLVASQFYDYHLNEDVVIFASGVSNSAANDSKAFQREELLFDETVARNPQKKIVYFSTCSIYDTALQHSAYVWHKLKMEDLIKEKSSAFLILRITNPVGRYNNPHTFFNFFVHCIQTGKPFDVWTHAERNIIDVDDFYRLSKKLIDDNHFNNTIVNIANPNNYKVVDIVTAIEKHFGKNGNYNTVDKGGSLFIDTKIISGFLDTLHINFSDDYIHQLLKKYF